MGPTEWLSSVEALQLRRVRCARRTEWHREGIGQRYVRHSHACEVSRAPGIGRRSSFTVRDDDASHIHRPFDASTPVGLGLTFLVHCFVTRGSYVKPFHGTCTSVSLLSDRSVAISRTVDL